MGAAGQHNTLGSLRCENRRGGGGEGGHNARGLGHAAGPGHKTFTWAGLGWVYSICLYLMTPTSHQYLPVASGFLDFFYKKVITYMTYTDDTVF